MHFRRLIPLALVLFVWAPPAHAETNPSVRMLSCAGSDADSGGAVTYAGGTVTYVARMHALPRTARMALRVLLYERFGDERFHRVVAPELGIWRRSQRGASVFEWTQHVRGLRRGGIYRAVVQFRWYDASGLRIHAAHVRSAACRQPGGLPNLRVARIDISPGDVKDTAVYRVRVVNRGTSAAKHVGVLLRVDGEVVDESVVISRLAPGEARTVSFDGPVCRKSLRAVVDPKELIPEADEQDNARAPGCV